MCRFTLPNINICLGKAMHFNTPFCTTVDWFCCLLWHSKSTKTSQTASTRTSKRLYAKWGPFLIVLHELAEKEKIYKDRFNINRADGAKKDLRRLYKITIEFPSLKTLFCSFWHIYSLFTHFSWRLWSSNAFLVIRNWLVTLTNSLEAVFKSFTQTRFWSYLWQCCEKWI